MSEVSGVRRDRAKRPKLGGDIITVLVDSDTGTNKFFIHADLVIQHSEFFQAALKRGWKEANERIVHLRDLPVGTDEVFEDFHSFLYSGKVYSSDWAEISDADYDDEWLRLGYAWVLGEVLLSVTFKDAVIDAIIHKLVADNCAPTLLYKFMYTHSTNFSMIRKLMVDIAVHKWKTKDISAMNTDDHPALADNATFLKDLAIALFETKKQSKSAKQAKGPFRTEGNCSYHEHGAGKPCYKTLFE